MASCGFRNGRAEVGGVKVRGESSLTLWRWENSMSSGVDRASGVGLMVTEITLELSTGLFLQREQRHIITLVTEKR